MEKNTKFKQVYINNGTCYYFDDIIKIENFVFNNVLLDEKLYQNILIFDVVYKTLIVSRPLRITFNKVNGFVKFYGGSKHLALFVSKKYNNIFNRIGILYDKKEAFQCCLS